MSTSLKPIITNYENNIQLCYHNLYPYYDKYQNIWEGINL